MRTNVVIDDQLIAEAMALTGIKTKRAVIDHALQLMVRNARQRALLSLEGKIHWEGDLDELRSGRFLFKEASDYYADEDPGLEPDQDNEQGR